MAPRYLSVSEIQSMNIVFFQLAATSSVNVNVTGVYRWHVIKNLFLFEYHLTWF